ncbi:MAG: hypothetical protein E6J91_37445 [Deltaproteobacteria bacterium]|nr:MAG: hypothetical protein E6J91_37445 [Deltaproteobacteria bacterium]
MTDTTDPNALQLSGTGSFSVNVQVDSTGTAQFSTTGSASTFPKIQWNTQGATTAATINFTFISDTSGNMPTSMTSDATSYLTFGTATSTGQTGTCQPTAAPNGHSFTVTYTTPSRQTKTTSDPIIIVTPPSR